MTTRVSTCAAPNTCSVVRAMAFLGALAMSACGRTIYSTDSLFPLESAIWDERLVGIWSSPENRPPEFFVEISKVDDRQGLLVTYDAGVDIEDDDGIRRQEFKLACVEVEDASYCSLSLPDGTWDFVNRTGKAPTNARYIHGRYEISNENIVTVYPMSEKALEEIAKESAISKTVSDNRLVIDFSRESPRPVIAIRKSLFFSNGFGFKRVSQPELQRALDGWRENFKMRRAAARRIDELIEQLKSTDIKVRFAAATELGDAGRQAQRAVPALTALLWEILEEPLTPESEELGRAVVAAFGKIRLACPSTVVTLDRAARLEGEPAADELASAARAILTAMEGRRWTRSPVCTGEIAEIQRGLKELGYDPGAVDGILGPKTTAAIRSLQRDRGVSEDGLPTPGLKSLLD